MTVYDDDKETFHAYHGLQKCFDFREQEDKANIQETRTSQNCREEISNGSTSNHHDFPAE